MRIPCLFGRQASELKKILTDEIKEARFLKWQIKVIFVLFLSRQPLFNRHTCS